MNNSTNGNGQKTLIEQTHPRFAYKGIGELDATCHLMLFNREGAGGQIVAVATEIVDDSGPSVTSSPAQLATQICGQFNIEPSKLVLVERYPEEERGGSIFDEGFSMVNLQHHPKTGFKKLGWKPLTYAAVAELTGVPVEEWQRRTLAAA